jgi:hypothetical protein
MPHVTNEIPNQTRLSVGCSSKTIQFTVCDVKQPTPLALQVVLDVVPTALNQLIEFAVARLSSIT